MAARWAAVCILAVLHNFDLFVRQPIQLIYLAIDRGIDLFNAALNGMSFVIEVALGFGQVFLQLQHLFDERSDVRFVNRQRGAGTRVLLDYRLNELGISPEAVDGYKREEYTHLAVAAAVQSSVADCCSMRSYWWRRVW